MILRKIIHHFPHTFVMIVYGGKSLFGPVYIMSPCSVATMPKPPHITVPAPVLVHRGSFVDEGLQTLQTESVN